MTTSTDHDEFKKYCLTAIGQQAQEYDSQNPQVWEMFKKYAAEVKNRGLKNYAAKAIFERIRWHMTIERKFDDFKINNNYTAYYARKMMCMWGYSGFFELRDNGGRVPLDRGLHAPIYGRTP